MKSKVPEKLPSLEVYENDTFDLRQVEMTWKLTHFRDGGRVMAWWYQSGGWYEVKTCPFCQNDIRSGDVTTTYNGKPVSFHSHCLNKLLSFGLESVKPPKDSTTV